MAFDTRNKRTPTERAVDLAALQVWLSLGWSVARMTEELARTRRYRLSERQVFSDVRRALADMANRSARQLFAEREVQAARHLAIYAHAMEAWERSKGERVKRSQKRTGPDADIPAGEPSARRELKVETHARDGDPRFLAVANAALEARSRLLGLLPQRTAAPAGDEAVNGALTLPPAGFTIRLEMTGAVQHLPDPEDRIVELSPDGAPNPAPTAAPPLSVGGITMRPSSFAS